MLNQVEAERLAVLRAKDQTILTVEEKAEVETLVAKEKVATN